MEPVLEPVLTYRIELPPDCDVHQMLGKLRQLEEEIPERQITLVEDSGKPQSIAVQKLLTYFK